MSNAKAKWQKEQEGKVTASPKVSKENRKVWDIMWQDRTQVVRVSAGSRQCG